MKEPRLLPPIVILFLAIILPLYSGCGDDKSTSPSIPDEPGCGYFETQDYSWTIEVYDPHNQNMRGIMVIYNGYFDPQNPPDVSLQIAGVAIPLTFAGYGNWWTGEASLNAGSSYSFELATNGQKMAANLAIAFTPHAVFPDNIVAGQPAKVTWTLDGPAACQLAAAGSGDMQDDEDNYTASLGNNARECTFPATCVPGWGDGKTHLSLAIFNRNVAMVGKALILISSGLATRDYQD